MRDFKVMLDDTGTELPDETAARAEAVRLLAQLVGDRAREFWAHGRWSVEVQDQRGVTVATLDFLAQVPIRQDRPALAAAI